MEKSDITVEKQNDKPWLFKKGQSGNPAGKPKGTFSLKTFAKNYLKNLTDDEKIEFMEGLPKEIVWKMAEGNPKQDTELSGEVNITPIYGNQSIQGHDSDSQDIQPKQKD
jgi:hypothetical protein